MDDSNGTNLLFPQQSLDNEIMERKSSFVLWFSGIESDDTSIVGEKAVKLSSLRQAKFPVSDGFVVSSYVYFQFLHHNKLIHKINQLLSTVHFEQPESLMQVSMHIKKLIMQAEVPEEIAKELFVAYKTLGGAFKHAAVTVSGSPLHDFQHGGQAQTVFVTGEANLLLAVRELWASLFEPAAILSRHERTIDHFRSGNAVIVQKQIHAEKSGLLFTEDPVTQNKSTIVIEAIYGLSELLKEGKVTPDHYEVKKSSLLLSNQTVAKQDIMLKIDGDKKKQVKVPSDKQKLTKNQILDLAVLGKKLEKHLYFPQTIEWAIEKNTIFIVHTSNLTPHPTAKQVQDAPSANLPLLLKGSSAAQGIARGQVKLIKGINDLRHFMQGDIFVASHTTSQFVDTMKKAGGIITDKGGWMSHAAVIAREHGIPAVIGTEKAMTSLKQGQVVTVHGTTGSVYQGTSSAASQLQSKTKLSVTLTNASQLEDNNQLNRALLQGDSVIKHLGIHPKKLIKDGKQQKYIDAIAEQLISIAKKMHPHQVIYQATSMTSAEYHTLAGGDDIEHSEQNPLIGFRGAYRYLHDPESFKLELEGIKKARKKWNNIEIMIPYVRNVKELVEVKRIMQTAGIGRSKDFKLWLSIETPATVILLEKLIEEGIDGVAIGINNLTTLILGTDKHNSSVAKEFDEIDPAVLWALEQTITTAKKHHLESLLFGQTPSFYPALFGKLIRWGITNISVTSNGFEATKNYITEAERKFPPYAED